MRCCAGDPPHDPDTESELSVIVPQQLRARADQILELHEDGHLDAALRACDELLDVAASVDVTDPVVRESVFAARFERGLLLTEVGDLAGAAAAYGEAAATPADLSDPDQRHEIAMALLNRAICQDADEDVEAALETYDRLILRFADADDPVTQDQVIRGRVNRAAVLLTLDRLPEALTAAEQLVARLDPQDALEADQLAMALRLRAATLRTMGRRSEAAMSLSEIDGCSVEEPAARAQVVAAQRERAELLVELGRTDAAIDLLGEVIARFRADADPVVIEVLGDVVAAQADLLELAGDPIRAAAVRATS